MGSTPLLTTKDQNLYLYLLTCFCFYSSLYPFESTFPIFSLSSTEYRLMDSLCHQIYGFCCLVLGLIHDRLQSPYSPDQR